MSQGQDAEVWLVRDVLTDRQLVQKTFSAQAGLTSAELANQIRLSQTLGDSGFLPALDVAVDDTEAISYTSRHIESGSLGDHAEAMDAGVLLDVLQQICQSLAYLHQLDYLHCDIKPDNILIETSGHAVVPWVTDLGLAVRRGSQFPTTIRGTAEYIAPEQREGKPLTEATDVYSFGRMLENLAARCKDTPVAEGLNTLATRCTRAAPNDRPQTFGDVRELLRKLHHTIPGESPWATVPPPLRDAGIRLRLALLRRQIDEKSSERFGLCLVVGRPGSGRSKILRAFMLERQLRGARTIRVSDVSAASDLIAGIPEWMSRLGPDSGDDASGPLTMIAETAPGCRVGSDELRALDSLAREYGIVLLLEYREWPASSVPDDIPFVRARHFTLRECIDATSHLHDNPTLAAVNGQMLQLATDGNPKLVRQYVRTWLTASRCDRDGEAIDFDHLDSATAEHWRGHYADLPPVLLDTLAEASLYHSDIAPRRLVRTGVSEADIVRQLEHLAACGWLKRSPVNSQDGSFRFACRSARNAVRCRLGSDGLQSHATAVLRSDRAESLPPADSWTLSRLSGSGQGVPDAGTLWDARRDLLDTKLATYALLIEYRRQRWTRRGELSSLASDIGDGYAALGSVRRQKRWAKLAFTEMRRRQPETTLSLDAARSLCRLYSLSDDLQEKMTTLSDLLDSNTAADSHVRGLLLSELSVAHLLKSEFQVACNRFFEAHHLLGTAAPESKEYVRNLNRLGLSLMRVGRFAAARKHLEQCRKLAQQFGFEYIRRLALGNLVILEWDMGDPHTAMQRSQRVLAEYRAAHDPLGYLAALQDKVMCQVNLGLCYAAARTARLAERLANLHSDPFELRHALNNLGWVLTMHGEVKEGRTYLNAAVRLHLRMDDSLWAARSRLNLAWNLLLVADLAEAERLCQTALEEILRHGDLQGQYEALRILSQIAIMREDFATAQKYLEDMPMDDPLFSPRNKAEASLAWLNLYVWTQQQSAAKHLIHELTDNAIVANVHPLQCDYERLRGFWHMLEGDHQRSLDILGTTAIDCRKSGRIDKLLDTMVALALLAGRMRNWSVGLRYLRAGKQMVDSMRGQLS